MASPGAFSIRYVPVNVATAAGVTAAAPTITNVDLGDVLLLSLHLRIPAGHAGLTGFRVDYSGETVVPWSHPSQWIIGDDDPFEFEIGREIGRTLRVVTYNLDVMAHTHYALMKVTDVTADVSTATTLVDIRP